MFLGGWTEHDLAEGDVCGLQSVDKGKSKGVLAVLEVTCTDDVSLVLEVAARVSKLVVFARNLKLAELCKDVCSQVSAQEGEFDSLIMEGAVRWKDLSSFLCPLGRAEQAVLAEEILHKDCFLVGQHPLIAELKDHLPRVASTDVPVLLLGETGTGKGLLARLIHLLSPRHGSPFVEINCAAIPGALVESELFGYKKGAFSGAVGDKQGKFHLSDQGTVFLDELSELSLSGQAKLLQVLQENTFHSLGGDDLEQVDVRVLSATNLDPRDMLQEGRLRGDLYFRISALVLRLPALRMRKSDIPLLAQYFWEENFTVLKKQWWPMPEGLMDLFMEYDWPGNVRELKNMLGNVVAMGSDRLVAEEIGARLSRQDVGSIQKRWQNLVGCCSLRTIVKEEIRELEKTWIKKAIQAARGNKKQAAALIDLSYKTLLLKVKEYGL